MSRFLYVVSLLFIGLSLSLPVQAQDRSEQAVFAGGCFWCMHAAFEQLEGVTDVQSGYTGGTVENPTYEQVSSGETGHVEAIQVTFNPDKVPYTKLLEWFWDNVDPTDPNGQFCDKGSQYLAGIFYTTKEQKSQAEQSIIATEARLKQKIVTFLRPLDVFYPAEKYHQSYYKKNKMRYYLYKQGCGRDQKLNQIWDK